MISKLVILAVLLSAVAADPAIVISNGFLQPFAYVAPSAPLVASPVAPVGSVAPVSPLSPLPPVPVTGSLPYTSVSDYRYSYGSALSYQDYAPVSSAALTLPYSLPYAYAADWYYRK